MTRILVLNGPNLGTLGSREPEIYGTQSLADIEAALRERSAELGVDIRLAHSNHEGALVDLLEEERAVADGCIINPGGLSHTSVVLADALRAFAHPVVEVHLSNIFAREPLRRVSLCAEAATAVISGFGPRGYVLAIDGLVGMLASAGMKENTT
jgi:3-dehydroquinate dehydratase-2